MLLLELTLLQIETELVFYQNFQHSSDSLGILFNSPGEDENIIQVYYYYFFSDEVPEDVIHYCLEDSQTVSHSKEHHQRFKQAIVGIESGLPLVSRLDAYIVETPADVQFSKVFGSGELQHEFGNEGQGILIFYHYGVESPVVLYQLERTVLLLDEEHQSGYR